MSGVIVQPGGTFPITGQIPGDDSAILQAAIDAAIKAGGGTVQLEARDYYYSQGLSCPAGGVYIRGQGRWATRLHFTGTGDAIRMYNPTYGGSQPTGDGGGVLGLSIDGTSAGPGSAGLHAGDQSALQFDVTIYNFSGAGSIGVHLDNTIWWTEEMRSRFWVYNCTQAIVFDVSGAATSTNSFGYNDVDAYVNCQPGQDGIVFSNGALFYHGRLRVRANMLGSASTPLSNAVLRVTGTVPAGHPGAGGYTAIKSSRLDVQAEVGAYANQPYTIYFGTAGRLGNVIWDCTGVLDFTSGGGTFQPSNWAATYPAGGMTFQGVVRGDANINPAATADAVATVGPAIGGLGSMVGANVYATYGDFFSATLSASITVNLTPGGALPAGPQRKTIVIKQAASGGPYTVTWPHAASPTTAAPTVLWAGGTAPVMSTGANAVDVYRLETLDGATWYGQAIQNVS